MGNNKSDYKVESVAIFQDNGSGEPGKEVEFFRPTDRVQHFLIKMEHVNFGNITGKWIFTAVNTVAGSDLLIYEASWNGLIANQFTGELSLDKDWPIGFYRADLIIKEELITSIDYIVTLPFDELKPESVRFLKDNGNEEPGEEVEFFEATDTSIHLEIVLNGLIPVGINTRWVLFNIENPDSLHKIGELNLEIDSPVNKISVSFSLTQDWLVGPYVVELYFDDNLFEKIPLEIK